MLDNPNQIPQLLHDAAPVVIGAFAAIITVILLISLLDRPYSSLSHRDHARRFSRDAPSLRRRRQSRRMRRRESRNGAAPSTEM